MRITKIRDNQGDPRQLISDKQFWVKFWYSMTATNAEKKGNEFGLTGEFSKAMFKIDIVTNCYAVPTDGMLIKLVQPSIYELAPEAYPNAQFVEEGLYWIDFEEAPTPEPEQPPEPVPPPVPEQPPTPQPEQPAPTPTPAPETPPEEKPEEEKEPEKPWWQKALDQAAEEGYLTIKMSMLGAPVKVVRDVGEKEVVVVIVAGEQDFRDVLDLLGKIISISNPQIYANVR